MDQGLVSNPKDLERMQHEMESLERRITTLEDEELEVMARLEDAQRSLDQLTAQLVDADARNAKLEEARDARYSEIDAELDRLADKRGSVAAGVPDDLIALYDRLRASKNGVGAAALRARQCSGCMTRPRQRRAGRDPRRRRGRGAPLRGVPADPGPHARSPDCEPAARVLIEADGGSRGNPGPAAYGAVLKDADTGEVIAEDGTTIGVATNNVAEYRGLIAGLTMAAELAPDAEIEVRMDSKLVVEQMSGRWKIKHPDMKPLAAGGQPAGAVRDDVHLGAARAEQARRPAGQRGARRQARPASPSRSASRTSSRRPRRSTRPSRASRAGSRWRPAGPATTLILVRHGVTAHTTEKRFSGGLASANPGLSDEGRDQIRATADWLAPLAERVDAVVASPVRRTRESAEILAERLGRRGRGGARLRRDGVRRLGRAHLRGGGSATSARPSTTWLGSVDERAGRRRVVP